MAPANSKGLGSTWWRRLHVAMDKALVVEVSCSNHRARKITQPGALHESWSGEELLSMFHN